MPFPKGWEGGPGRGHKGKVEVSLKRKILTKDSKLVKKKRRRVKAAVLQCFEALQQYSAARVEDSIAKFESITPNTSRTLSSSKSR